MNYEPREASLRTIGIAAGLLAVWIALSIVVSAWLYRAHYAVPTPAGKWLRQSSFTSGPAETTNIAQEWGPLEHDFESHLHEYGWVDQKQGIARVPIDRAMDMILSRGVAPAGSATPAEREANGEGAR
jgi:hypothetical protein